MMNATSCHVSSCGKALWHAVVARQLWPGRGWLAPVALAAAAPSKPDSIPGADQPCAGAGLSWMAVLTVRGSLQRLANSCSRHHRDSSD